MAADGAVSPEGLAALNRHISQAFDGLRAQLDLNKSSLHERAIVALDRIALALEGPDGPVEDHRQLLRYR